MVFSILEAEGVAFASQFPDDGQVRTISRPDAQPSLAADGLIDCLMHAYSSTTATSA